MCSSDLLIGMLVGLLVSIFQATTQIQEQTLTFIPKIVAVLVSIVIFGPWMIRQLVDFADRLLSNLPSYIMFSFHRDGQMRTDGNLGSENHYEPNSYGNWKDDLQYKEPLQKGGDVYRYDFREDDDDYYTQPGLLYNAMTEDQKRVLFANTARNMGDSTLQIKHRHINNCYQADPEYGKGVADALHIDIKDVDLDLPARNSHDGNYEANNIHPELNVPSEDISSIPNQEEIKTDYDPKSFIAPEDDPHLL